MAAAAPKTFEDGPAPVQSRPGFRHSEEESYGVSDVPSRQEPERRGVRGAGSRREIHGALAGYWLVLEPSYQETRRNRGFTTTAKSFSFLDYTFAVGGFSRQTNLGHRSDFHV